MVRGFKKLLGPAWIWNLKHNIRVIDYLMHSIGRVRMMKITVIFNYYAHTAVLPIWMLDALWFILIFLIKK